MDYIWKSARLERLDVTYSNTEAICSGMDVSGVRERDIVAVKNLKRAWQFVLETLDHSADYGLVCEINRYVGGDNLIDHAGALRDVPVSIGGTTWKPEMPVEFWIKKEMAQIGQIENPTDRALTMTLYLLRKQMFLDGNKRTSMLVGNHVMIANGCGILTVPIEFQMAFRWMLVRFYESNDMAELKRFLYEHCIDGATVRDLTEK